MLVLLLSACGPAGPSVDRSPDSTRAPFAEAVLDAGARATPPPADTWFDDSRTPWKLPSASRSDLLGVALERRLADAASMPKGTDPARWVQVRMFYQERAWRPVWLEPRGVTPVAVRLLEALDGAARVGLPAARYPTGALAAASSATFRLERIEPGMLADLELRFTDAFLRFASDRLNGVTSPAEVSPRWKIRKPPTELGDVLREVARRGEVSEVLDALRPLTPEEVRMARMLERYRQIAASGGWPSITAGTPRRRGEEGPGIAQLQRRLALSGDLEPDALGAEGVFDERLESGVRRFQARHGLEPDGIIGQHTLAALNVPVERRIEALEVNLERLRWLPSLAEPERIEVNIPDFRLTVLEAGRPVLSMKVVVGKETDGRATPIFAGQVEYVVFNPYWNIPASITRKEILPQVLRDPGYLASRRYEIVTGFGTGARVIDPGSIDWRSVTPASFPYHLRQKPGAGNALGHIKFIFPNPYQVYLHDTPEQAYFDSRTRAFSHGCIRVADPIGLAERVFRASPEWDRARILQAIGTGRRKVVSLPAPVPIYMLYFTAFVTGDEVEFRPDVYSADAPILEALRKAAEEAPQKVG